MPTAPRRPCSCRPGCPEKLPRGQRYCTSGTRAHNQSIDDRRGSRQSRGYGRDHEIWAGYIRARDPICCVCQFRATEVADHIVPKQFGGENTETNGQGLCHPCHNAKRAAEREIYRELGPRLSALRQSQGRPLTSREMESQWRAAVAQVSTCAPSSPRRHDERIFR